MMARPVRALPEGRVRPHGSLLQSLVLTGIIVIAASVMPLSSTAAEPGVALPKFPGLKPPDPFQQPSIPLPPAPSPRNVAPDASTSDGPLVSGGPDHKTLTEDDVYGIYQRGYFVEAFALATELAKKGTREAMTLIGHLYEVGQGVRQDTARAREWFQLAADRGDREAQVALGLIYLNGEGVKRDEARAWDYFTAAAAQDQPTALFNLAILNIEGTVKRPDIDNARKLMRRAAELGNAEAAYSYALILDSDNLPGQESEITYWMGLAARAGQVPAEVEYAIRLAKGRGAEPDIDTAVIFLNRAAWAGNAVAQNRIAHLYATGIGLPFDSVEAAKWHLIAKAGGVQDTQLEDLLTTLKPDELARARALALDWPHTPTDPSPKPLQTAASGSPQFELRGPLDFPRPH